MGIWSVQHVCYDWTIRQKTYALSTIRSLLLQLSRRLKTSQLLNNLHPRNRLHLQTTSASPPLIIFNRLGQIHKKLSSNRGSSWKIRIIFFKISSLLIEIRSDQGQDVKMIRNLIIDFCIFGWIHYLIFWID